MFLQYVPIGSRLSTLLLLIASSSVCLAQETGGAVASAKETTVTVQIVSEHGDPVPDARVEIRLWGGKGEWIGTEHRGVSNEHGRLNFKGVLPHRYLTLLVHAEGFAPAMQDFQLGESETRVIRCKLSEPVESWFQVTSPSGQPLSGVDVAYLEIKDANQSLFAVTSQGIKLLYPGFKTSDEYGRVVFPALPKGGTITCQMVHSDWAAVRPVDQEIVPGNILDVSMAEGTRVTLDLSGDPLLMKQIENKKASIRLHANGDQAGHRALIRLIHTIPVIDSKITFTVHPGQYEQLRINIGEDTHVTPFFPSGIYGEPRELDFSSSEASLPLLVRSRVKVAVRVKLPDGTPCEGVSVSSSTENLTPSTDTGSVRRTNTYQWSPVDVGRTDKDGFVEMKMVPGSNRASVEWSGYYLKDEFVDFSVAGGESGADKSVVEIEVLPMPILRGTVVGDLDRPVPRAVVRLRSEHYLGEAKYYRTDESGTFAIPLVHFPYDMETRQRLNTVHVVAFDPSGIAGSVTVVDLYDETSFGDIKLEMEAKSPEWILSAVPGELEIPDEFLRVLEEMRGQFPLGKIGDLVPDMSEGAWLNSDARSLADYRGKFVLLDFWFIGCSPCMRDMPSVKLAQELFGDRDFAVVSVHTNTQTADNVRQFAKSRGMDFPIVVDNQAGDIVRQYEKHGVSGFPAYLLLDPQGKIVANDALGEAPSLRGHKLELIYRAINQQDR